MLARAMLPSVGLRAWGQRSLQSALPPAQNGVAVALLLGEGSTMTNADWDKYKRTGVIHALAISGQHLVVLAMFLWLVLRAFGVRRQRVSAVVVAIVRIGIAFAGECLAHGPTIFGRKSPRDGISAAPGDDARRSTDAFLDRPS